MSISIAIVGAGPSGFYTAEAVIKSGIDCQIDIIDSLPTPFGLIRAGVAPDHQSTKNVSRAYERTARDPHVRYFGNIQIGRDISLDQLRNIYDAVVLAVGAPLDQWLDIPGADKHGVYGSAEFVAWYNGHPDYCDLNPDLNTQAVAVIGNGNVAVDVARLLVKTKVETASSDLPDYAVNAFQNAPITDVTMIGRRGPVEAKFTNKELSEFGVLTDCTPVVDSAQLPDAVTGEMSDRDRRLREKNLATLRGFAERPAENKPKRLHFLFFAKPVAILGGDRVEALRLERTRVENGRAVGTGEHFEIPCGVVVAAIGYRMQAMEGVVIDPQQSRLVSQDGRIEKGLYAVGWAKRGPTGVIGTNKSDGDVAAAQIIDDFPQNLDPKDLKPGRLGFEKYLAEHHLRSVSFADWKRIDAAEIAAAPDGAPRRKLVRVADMIAVLDDDAEVKECRGTNEGDIEGPQVLQ